MTAAVKYSYDVVWSEEDQKYAGLCSDFTSLIHLDRDPVRALSGIINLVTGCLNDMFKNKEKPPVPLKTNALNRHDFSCCGDCDLMSNGLYSCTL